jgi:fatty acid desaturase
MSELCTMGVNRWPESLSQPMRQRLRDLHRIQYWRHLKILVLAGLWFGVAALALEFDSLWLRLPCWIVIGFCLHGLGVFMHEGAHHNLFRHPVADRLIGFLCGVPVMISCSNYRATHMLHHHYENTANDPDNLATIVPGKISRWFIYYGWYLVGMPVYAVLLLATGPWRAERQREKLICVLEGATLVAIYSSLAWAAPRFGITKILLVGWVAGLVAASLIANMRGLAEHTLLYQGNPPDPLQTTRSTPSNPLVSFFFNNQNYHLEHHLFPRVPWHNLVAVHRLLEPIYRSERAAVCPGYLEYLASAFRRGPFYNVRYGP